MAATLEEWEMDNLWIDLQAEAYGRGFVVTHDWSIEEMAELLRVDDGEMKKYGLRYNQPLLEFDFEAAENKYHAMSY
jgi:hypothetical protein